MSNALNLNESSDELPPKVHWFLYDREVVRNVQLYGIHRFGKYPSMLVTLNGLQYSLAFLQPFCFGHFLFAPFSPLAEDFQEFGGKAVQKNDRRLRVFVTFRVM